MKIERMVFPGLALLLYGFSALPCGADSGSHDFRSQAWAKGRSCAVCHVIRNGVPSLMPPSARAVDPAHLTPEEARAVELHSSNRLCFVCHQTNSASNGNASGHSVVGDSASGGLPVGPGGPSLPPSTGNGTLGSICVRINNQGAKGMDCLGCHDVHNFKSRYFLRSDYGQVK